MPMASAVVIVLAFIFAPQLWGERHQEFADPLEDGDDTDEDPLVDGKIEYMTDNADGDAEKAKQQGHTIEMECTGSRWNSKGDCGKVSIGSVDGTIQKVQLYCYGLGGTPGTKASSDETGVCQIPRKKACLEDRQCRRGTFCKPSETDMGYACQDIRHTIQHTGNVAPTISATLMLVVDKYLAALSHAKGGLIRDPRTGAVSPYGSNPQLAKSALQDLSRSFQHINETYLGGKNSASKSGAIFVFSGDGRFVIKSIHESEYTTLIGSLVERLAGQGRFDNLTCASTSSEPLCWASHAMSHTSLVLPLLAYSNPKQGEYWIVMPTAAQLRGFAASRDLDNLFPWGTVRYFDTKPLPAKSNARPTFLQTLQQRAFLPQDQSAHAEQRTQWEELNERMHQDLALLSVTTKDQPPLVDYSLLWELYEPHRTVTHPGPGCLSSAECFEGDGHDCWVLCVSIIDYFVTFGPMRKLESFFKGGKFSAYGTKVDDMLSCSFRQGLPWGTEVTKTREGSSTKLNLKFRNYKTRWDWEQSVCRPYMKIVCGDLRISDYTCTPDVVLYQGLDFEDRLKFCGSYLAMKAVKLAEKEEERLSNLQAFANVGVAYPFDREFDPDQLPLEYFG